VLKDRSIGVTPAFSLTKIRPWLLAGLAALLWLLGSSGRFFISGAIVLFVPGWLAWSYLGQGVRLPRLAAPAVWLGLSLSLVPLLYLWLSTLGLSLTPPVLQLLAAAITLLALWRLSSRINGAPEDAHGGASLHRSLRVLAPFASLRLCSLRLCVSRYFLSGAFIGLLGLTAATRVSEIRGLALPPWVDSVHHTLLVRIVGETGRIPTSLEPFLPVDNLKYHWGYHTVVAAWRSLAGLPLAPMVLWSGQALNSFVVLGAYALAASALRSPLGGLLGAGVAGLLSIMPAYYVSWGRYTQLTGLLILAPLLVATAAALERPHAGWRMLLVPATLLAGLMLVHYRVLVFYAAWALPFVVLLRVYRSVRLLVVAGRLLLIGVLALLLALPWSALMVQRAIVPVVGSGNLAGTGGYNAIDESLLFAGNGRALYIAAAFGVLVSLRRWRVVAIAAWVGVLLLIANPQIVGLPPSWLINNHSVVITLFLPVAVLAAAAALQLLRWLGRLPRRWGRPLRRAALAGCAGLALVGAWQLREVVNTQTVLALPQDVAAIEWAAANTPPQARFLVNATPWLDGAYRGADAGWWLLPLAGRWVSAPPALYIYGAGDYKADVEAFNSRFNALDDADIVGTLRLAREAGITHIYIGGTLSGPLRADVLAGDPALETVYDRDGVTIFALRPDS